MVNSLMLNRDARSSKLNQEIPLYLSNPIILYLPGLVFNCGLICSITYQTVIVNLSLCILHSSDLVLNLVHIIYSHIKVTNAACKL